MHFTAHCCPRFRKQQISSLWVQLMICCDENSILPFKLSSVQLKVAIFVLYFQSFRVDEWRRWPQTSWDTKSALGNLYANSHDSRSIWIIPETVSESQLRLVSFVLWNDHVFRDLRVYGQICHWLALVIGWKIEIVTWLLQKVSKCDERVWRRL